MKQRGVALIIAIVMVAIATVLAVRIGTRASLDQRRTAGLIALDQAWHVALGAEAWAIEVLRKDCEDSKKPITSVRTGRSRFLRYPSTAASYAVRWRTCRGGSTSTT